MTRIELEAITDESGCVRIRLPGMPSSARVHVVLEWERQEERAGAAWPAGWIEATAGAIVDDSFVRPEQPGLEEREAFT